MIYKSHKSKLDQYLPAMLLALEIKKHYRGQMTPQEMGRHIQGCLWGGGTIKTNDGVSPPADIGLPPSRNINTDDTLFVACAFIDEALMNSRWSERDKWPGHSLVRFYFDTAQAGIVFFDRLSQLLQEQGEVKPSDDLDLNVVKSFGYNVPPRVNSFIPSQRTGFKTHLKFFVKTQVKQLWKNLKLMGAALNGTFEQAPLDMSVNQDFRLIDPWKETIEVYAAALSLGFVGRHYGPDGRKSLELIKRDTALALGPPLTDVAGQWPDMVAQVKPKPTARFGEFFITFLQFSLPVLVVLFFILLHKSMLVKFTVDWAKTLGAMP